MLSLLLFSMAWADAPGRPPAEYQRLSDEMVRMAKAGNWTAVERSFSRMETIGHPHTFRVLVNAAHAARERGDIGLARERLLEADQLETDPDVKQWLWSIQQDYAPVFVAADLPANYRLVPAAMPFVPDKRRAVLFAQGQVVEDSAFKGLLPKGQYTFRPFEEEGGGHVFTFDLRRERPTIDLRTRETPTRRDRRRRARIDKRLAEQGA